MDEFVNEIYLQHADKRWKSNVAPFTSISKFGEDGRSVIARSQNPERNENSKEAADV